MANKEIYDAFDEAQFEKLMFDQQSMGFLAAHRGHGKNEKEGNACIGRLLAYMGERVLLIENNNNEVSPDAERNDVAWEFKTITEATNLRTAVQRHLRQGKKQCGNVLLFVNQEYKISDITFGIYNAIKFDKSERIEKICVLLKGERLVEFGRGKVLDKSFVELF